MAASFDEVFGRVFLHDDRDVWVRFGETAQQAGQEVRSDGRNGTEPDTASPTSLG